MHFLFIPWKGIVLDEACPCDVVCCLHIPESPRRTSLGGAVGVDEEVTKSKQRFPWVIPAACPARTAPLSSQPCLTQGSAVPTWAARCRLCSGCGRIRPSYSAGQAGDNEGSQSSRLHPLPSLDRGPCAKTEAQSGSGLWAVRERPGETQLLCHLGLILLLGWLAGGV